MLGLLRSPINVTSIHVTAEMETSGLFCCGAAAYTVHTESIVYGAAYTRYKSVVSAHTHMETLALWHLGLLTVRHRRPFRTCPLLL